MAPRTVGVPQLAGISTLRGNQRSCSAHQSSTRREGRVCFLAVGDELHGVEVTKIDLSQGLVEVLVRGQTFPLELDKKSDAGNGSTVSVVRPSGSIIGLALVGKPKSQVKADNPKPPPGNGLKPVPTRTRSRFSLAWNILRRLELVALSRLNSISACKSILPIRPVYRRSVVYAARFPWVAHRYSKTRALISPARPSGTARG